MRFQDKVVIVTGAGSGIGAATANRFAKEGALLCLADINAAALAVQAKAIDPSGKRTLLRTVDVSQQQQVEDFVAASVAQFGRLDVLVNNAGMGVFGPVTTLSTEDWRKVFSIVVDGVFFGCKAAVPHLIKSGGNVVNLGSVSGLFGDYGFAGYNAAWAPWLT